MQRGGAERAGFVDVRAGGQQGLDAFQVAGLRGIVQVAGRKRTRQRTQQRQAPHTTMVERFGAARYNLGKRMKKRLLNVLAIVLLAISVVLVIWQGSFNFGEYGPSDVTQTFIYWAVSSLVFVLMVTLAFILFRTGLKLYIERRSNREGSRLRTKLVIGALALSSMPVFFLVLFSVSVLNYNLDKWFSQTGGNAGDHLPGDERGAEAGDARRGRALQAALLAAQPETRWLLEGARVPGFLEGFRKEQQLMTAAVVPALGEVPADAAGPFPLAPSPDGQVVVARAPVQGAGRTLGYTVVAAQVPVNIAANRRRSREFIHDYGTLAFNRKALPANSTCSLMILITLFVLFFATWIALLPGHADQRAHHRAAATPPARCARAT